MKLKLDVLTSTAAFGTVIMVTTMGLFLNGAHAVDLNDFSAIDQKMITQEAPKAGGIALIKEDTVTRANGPVLTAVSTTSPAAAAGKEGTYYDYNNIAPAAGGNTVRANGRYDTIEPIPAVQPAATLSGRTVPPVTTAGLGGPNDSATDPTDPYAKVQARLNAAGTAQAPQPGSAHAVAELEAGVTPTTPVAPLVNTMSTQSMAANAPAKKIYESPSDLSDVAPAAGGNDDNAEESSPFPGNSQSGGFNK